MYCRAEIDCKPCCCYHLCVLLQVYQLWVVRAIVVMGKMCTTMQMLVLRVSLTVQLLVAAHLGVR